MNDPTPILDAAAWAEYLEKLRSCGAPMGEWAVRPGLSDTEIDRRLATIGLALPDEARVLWHWHDGIPEDSRANPLGGFKGRFLSLGEAVEVYQGFRETVLKIVEGDPDIRYRPSWLPLLGPQHPLVIDCAVARDQPTPLRMVDLADPEEPPVDARSLGEVVQLWSHALDCGLWIWDPTAQDWRVDLSSLPPIDRASPLL
jgi:cell wall assembly regulator SMI1